MKWLFGYWESHQSYQTVTQIGGLVGKGPGKQLECLSQHHFDFVEWQC